MIVILGAVVGAVTGTLVARSRKGKLADLLQYGFVYALLFAVIGLFATLMLDRLLG